MSIHNINIVLPIPLITQRALLGLLTLAAIMPFVAAFTLRGVPEDPPSLYCYTLSADESPDGYDEAVAASCLQGVINRDRPVLYLLSKKNPRPQYWLDLLSRDGRWLQARSVVPVGDLGGLVRLAGKRLKGAVVWDPAVPATLNVATTVAGVEDAVVLSPEMASRYLGAWHLPIVADFRGRFTGLETGSAKNDAYRWAIREYLSKGRCSAHRLCLFEDAYGTRAGGSIRYALTRDWAIYNRAFVFDLSPWGDERPKDDPGQRLGLDLETYHMILEATLRQTAGRQETELTGFFNFEKYSNVEGHSSSHEPVPTEWETVWLITPYNFYQNTVSSDCFNQSFHSQAPKVALRQRAATHKPTLARKAYVCIFMADYDSSTPLYDTLPVAWDDGARGALPLAWGINPNLVETYPDLIAYYYGSATEADTFTADASAAGYFNPNRVRPEYLPLFIEHNRRFFAQAGMDLAPMVLDFDQPSAQVKDAFLQFAPAGMGTIVYDFHNRGGKAPTPHVWKGMPVVELINDAGAPTDAEHTAAEMAQAIVGRGAREPGFYLFRIVWTKPSTVVAALVSLRRRLPDLDLELEDPHAFFALFREHESGREPAR